MKKIQFGYFLMMVLVLSLAWGCADSSSTGNVKEIAPKTTIHITDNSGTININPNLDTDSEAGDFAQETKNSADISPRTTANAGWNGGTASGQLDSAGAFVEMIGRRIQDWSRADSDNLEDRRSVTSNEPKIVEDTPTIVVTEPEPGQPQNTVSTEPGRYNNVEGYDLKPAGNGRNFQWLTHNGGYYGKDIKIVFDTGESFTVRDGSISTDQNGGGNMGLMWWFSGNDFEPGTGEHNPSQYEPGKGRASAFSAAGSSARSMKIYFNR